MVMHLYLHLSVNDLICNYDYIFFVFFKKLYIIYNPEKTMQLHSHLYVKPPYYHLLQTHLVLIHIYLELHQGWPVTYIWKGDIYLPWTPPGLSSGLFKSLSHRLQTSKCICGIWTIYCYEGLSWSYGSWIYNYLCNQCLSPLKLWVRIPFMARCTRYNMW